MEAGVVHPVPRGKIDRSLKLSQAPAIRLRPLGSGPLN
jgi:hypothetical protein